ncbi:TIGR04222 domain-containing membrane protein [Actinomadura fibrosa]|uniref:TIGR04222 domain-containing membrane protein n=1 Tax=Actinomadura fibrosa TaxID=111802 RepID=A0ABW2XW64_9ACTN
MPRRARTPPARPRETRSWPGASHQQAARDLQGARMGELSVYETAYLCGGRERVVKTAVLSLYEQRRVRVSRGTHRVEAVRREADDPVQEAVLAAIPGTGRLLGQVVSEVAAGPELEAVRDGLRRAGLLNRLSRPTRRGRAERRRLAGGAGTGPSRFAALGPSGVEESKMRDVLSTKDPKPFDFREQYRPAGGAGPLSSGGVSPMFGDAGGDGGGDWSSGGDF